MKIFKKQTVWGYLSIVSGVLVLVGFIFYLVTSVSGYCAEQSFGVDGLLIAFSVIAVLLLILLPLFGDTLGRINFFKNKLDKVDDLVLIICAAFIAVSIARFILARQTLAADLYFIPVDYPDSEVTAFNLSVVGLVFYVIGFLALVVTCFGGDLNKRQQQIPPVDQETKTTEAEA